MRAEQFIKDHGLEKAREVVEGAPEGYTHIDIYEGVKYLVYCKGKSNQDDEETISFNPRTKKEIKGGFVQSGMNEFGGWYIPISSLKRLVESVDIIKFHEGINGAKLIYKLRPSDAEGVDLWVRLAQAIADYESIYGEE